MQYISQTQDVNHDQLKEILDKSKIDGGAIMPTLAQQYREQFREDNLRCAARFLVDPRSSWGGGGFRVVCNKRIRMQNAEEPKKEKCRIEEKLLLINFSR